MPTRLPVKRADYKKTVLVFGSIAYDDIRSSSGKLTKRSFGGCAGNIVFNAKLLGHNFILTGFVGHDFANYKKWFSQHKISIRYVLRNSRKKTAYAEVKNRKNGTQQVHFHPGASDASVQTLLQLSSQVAAIAPKVKFAILSPNPIHSLVKMYQACKTNHIPYFFDPGPVIPAFSKEQIRQIIADAQGVFVNEDELESLKKKSGWSVAALRSHCPLLVSTRSLKGSTIYTKSKTFPIRPIFSKKPRDPTGCGDAYRAGFLATILPSFPTISGAAIKKAGAVGSRLATMCLEKKGPQNHHT